MNKRFSVALLAAIFLSSPVVAAKKPPSLTPMEVQALQSHEFETTKEILFASVVSVFQDLGYQIENADLPSGFITASSATTNKTSFWEAMANQASTGNTRATAYIEQFAGGRAKVRLNFLNTKMSSGLYGQSAKNDKPILDPQTYQIAWEKIDEAIFVRSATKASPAAPPSDNTTTTIAPASKSPTTSTPPQG